MEVPLKINLEWWEANKDSLSKEERDFVEGEIAKHEAIVRANPLQAFQPHSEAQKSFISAVTAIVAAFAGNRFGKSTALVVCALRELLPREWLPEWLQSSKRFDAPLDGWILCPTDDKIYDSMMPALKKWCPPGALKGGNFDKAWNGARNILTFACGSTLAFKTYKQDPSTLGGAELRFVGYDEPPPKEHREESRMRLMGGGFEMFAMTPLKSNTGYVRRVIWKKRESPNITVVKGSIHDNPTLDKVMIQEALGDMSDLWRKAREFGDFVDVGGLIYPDFERCVLDANDPRIVKRDGRFTFNPDFIRTLDVVVGIDPGIRNAGFSWVGFDRDLTGYLFEEGMLQDKVAEQYVAFIKTQNERWGLRDLYYVIDPAAKQRAQANGMTVLSEINKAGIYPSLGQNDLQLGLGQMRTRMLNRRLLVAPNCVLHRDQADDYAGKEPAEGKDDSHLEPIEVGAHCLASLRYAVMERFWDAVVEDRSPEQNLGFEPGKALPARLLTMPAAQGAPMGSLS